MKETKRVAFTKRTLQFQHQRMSFPLLLVFLALYAHIFRGNSTPKSSLSLSLSAKYSKRVYSFSTFATKRDAFHIIYYSLLSLHFP